MHHTLHHPSTIPAMPFRLYAWKGYAEQPTTETSRAYVSQASMEAKADELAAAGYSVHLESWQPDNPQDDINRGWALYAYRTPDPDADRAADPEAHFLDALTLDTPVSPDEFTAWVLREAKTEAGLTEDNLDPDEPPADVAYYLADLMRRLYRVANRGQEPPDPRVEVLVEHDPDGGPEARVWVNGVEQAPHVRVVEYVDPGRGYTDEEWEEGTAAVNTRTSYSDAFRAAVIATRDGAEDSPFITGGAE